MWKRWSDANANQLALLPVLLGNEGRKLLTAPPPALPALPLERLQQTPEPGSWWLLWTSDSQVKEVVPPPAAGACLPV